MPTATDNNPIDEKTEAGHGAYLNNAENTAAAAADDQRDAFEREFGGENYKKDGTPGDLSGGTRQAEENPINYTGGGQQGTRSGKFKKKGPVTTLIVSLLGGVGVMTLLSTPGIGIVQMKEVLTGDLNDQLAAMDLRSDHVFRAKLKDMSSGVCGQKVTIRCKFTTMSKRQIAKFQKAGFTDIETKNHFGRQKIVSMTAPDGTKITNPAELTAARKNNPKVRAAMNRVYNPLYYGLADKVAAKVFSKNKTNKSKKVTGNNEEERRKALVESTAGDKVRGNNGVLMDSDGKEYVVDEDGKKVYNTDADADKFNRIKEQNLANNERINSKPTLGGKAATSVLKSGLKGISIIGAADTACTVYNTARAVGAAAKIARSMQLIQFSMIILSTADSIKAGDATPEEVEFIGNMLTEVDMRETVVNETSTIESVSASSTGASSVPNPFYKKSAFDSPGYKTAAYNDAPILTSQSQQYMVGGGLSGTLTGVMDDIANTLGGRSGIRSTCGIVQSWWMRGIGFAAGIFAAVGSFGVSTAISIGASVAIGFALPFLEAALADIVAGTVIGENIGGVEAGDAAFAGSGALLGSMAQSRGLQPLDKPGLQSYLAISNEVKTDIAAAEKYEARDTPFDVMNQYSFMGSFVRSINPSVIKVKSGATGIISSLGTLFSTATNSLITPTKANQTFNEQRFSRCNDDGYAEIGVDADVFCNVRYGLTGRELAMDTTEVVDYMINMSYIDEVSGEAKGQYKDFIEKCVDREDGWGESSEENGSIGLECIDGHSETFNDISYFRVYTIDSSINEGMEEEPTNESSNMVTGTPDDVTEAGQGWTVKEGTDYSSVACPSGTTMYESVYTHSVKNVKFNRCKINGTGIIANSLTAANAAALVTAAAADGLSLDGGGYRTLEEQKALRNAHCRNPESDPASACSPPTAPVGQSQHELGLAIDFSNCGTRSTACYKWLSQNASKFGYYNLPSEAWHWSTSGW